MPAATARRPKATKKPTITQLEATRLVVIDGQQRTLKQIATAVRRKTRKAATEASISARLRDLRKAPYNYTVIKVADGEGGFLYSVMVPASNTAASPVRPISYGQPGAPGAQGDSGEPGPNTPVAGSRSAMSFANSLK